MTGAPRILLVATLRWPLAARLAIAFRRQGCEVQAWCPGGHPLEKTQAVARIHRGRVLAPLSSLRAALEASAPHLVVPCDDDAALHLQRLHARLRAGGGAQALCALIERSLGAPASCRTATARGALMALAAGVGVRVPDSAPLAGPADLEAWMARHGLPAVLKADRSWGGLGVAVVRSTLAARAAWRRAARPSAGRALSHLLMRRDASPLLRWLRGDRPALTVQALVAGRPANRAVACWQGEVLAGISVVALQTRTDTGPATVAQVIENAEMTTAAAQLVRALGLSGFCGFDFMLDSVTDAAWLIEVNPRATPICHLSSGTGPLLPAALLARLLGAPAPPASPVTGHGTIALFPGEWERNPLSPHLRTAFHDVPWEEADLVRECVAAPWEERGLVARLRESLRPARLPRPAFPPAPLPGQARPLRS
jgi:glutathione synthase/RimK-type ligase-like ATP-grasp enzyme